MRIKLGILRRLIAEEVDRMIRNSAGFCGMGGVSGNGQGSIESAPPGLGDEGEQEEQEENQYGKEQEKSQFAVRVDDRRK